MSSLELLNTIKKECKMEKQMFSFESKRYMFNHINKLSVNEMMYIFQIISSNSEEYTRNKNGIFFDLNHLSDGTLLKIKEYVDIIISSKEKNSML